MKFQNNPVLSPFFATTAFSTEEAEWLCDPDYTAAKKASAEAKKGAQAIKEEIARLLFSVFDQEPTKKAALDTPTEAALTEAAWIEEIRAQTAQDPWKATQFSATAATQEKRQPPSKYQKWRLITFYNWHAWWFTGIRLFMVRFGRVMAKTGYAFMPAFFSLFGLSYGLAFLVDLLVVLKVTFNPRSIREALDKKQGFFKPTWIRFKTILTKDNRPYRMLNDSVWFIVNCVVFCAAGPWYVILNPILNTIGFSFDAVHETGWCIRDYYKNTILIRKLTKNIQDKSTIQKENEKRKQQALQTNNTLSVDQLTQQIQETTKQIQVLSLICEQITQKRHDTARRRLWASGFTTLILVGMLLIYFPPTALPGAVIIGSAIALAAGSIFTGLGRRLYLTIEDIFNDYRKKKSQHTPPAATTITILAQMPIPQQSKPLTPNTKNLSLAARRPKSNNPAPFTLTPETHHKQTDHYSDTPPDSAIHFHSPGKASPPSLLRQFSSERNASPIRHPSPQFAAAH
ncbi:MAG: hypothetical protein A3F43_05550 [Gammaproteobacteria bacterium RIFCSPHIGHO2_12_FULL_42_10]|nr:MAG: hypothetical protein A3F43_05550 [Gammaproteobacteria bacterium RIFCSPHIGHO2_12_FULL_42_10]